MFVELAIPVAVDSLFTYHVPPEFREILKPGMRASAPFGKRTVIGIAVKFVSQSPVKNTKSIFDVLDTEPLLSDELLKLSQWISEYYCAPMGEVLRSVLVQGATKPGKRMVTLAVENPESALEQLASSPRQTEILRLLIEKKSLSYTQLKNKLASKNILSLLSGLSEKGFIQIEENHPGQSLKKKYELAVEVTDEARSRWHQWLSAMSGKRFTKQRDIVHALTTMENGSVSALELLKKTKTSLSALKSLQKKEVVSLTRREVIRVSEYDLYESALGAQNIVLNQHQNNALSAINAGIDAGKFQTYLLHGVTGSGKTQIYIEAIQNVRDKGKSAIVLVPEIALTPQIVRRFKFHFGDQVAALHSKMSAGERYDAWRLTKEGKYSIVIGPRSAVFAPLNNIGLIIVDEEHEPSYKQFDQTPRYHARDVAIIRGSFLNVPVVLGSATPSMESYANAMSGKYTLIELPERVDAAKLPAIDIVDMTAERKRKLLLFREERLAEFKADAVKARSEKRKFEFGSLSDVLKEKIGDRLRKKEGIILLQNRRGFSSFVECPDCGYVETCDRCDISLTYHQTQRHLRCHYCGLVKQPPDTCPQCGSTDITYRGFGTQRVEDELQEAFPSSRIIRMDLDTTTQRGAHDAMLKQFSEGEADILLGTQMVAKGLDFSRVTLVGVISADTQMLLPDFRSSERTFQLLTQVAGRAGRSALAGEVVIQTFQPGNSVLSHVVTHDFLSFYNEEIAHRKELHYPPFSRLALIEFKGKNEQEVMKHATAAGDLMKRLASGQLILGPASAAIPKIKNMYRWHIVVKGIREKDPSGSLLHKALRKAIDQYHGSPVGKSKAVKMTLDIDPHGMM
jgi:primosomal protein N' (replication factor Y)